VDLDELARIGEVGRRSTRSSASGRSFDELVGSDGMLKREEGMAKASGNDTSNNGLRSRGGAGFAAGAAAAAAMSNPFSDDHVLFDRDDNDEEAHSPKPFTYSEPGTRATTATLSSDDMPTTSTPANEPLIDLTPCVYVHPDVAAAAGVASNSTPMTPQSPNADTEPNQAAESFYSFASSSHHFDDDAEHLSTGTLTPRSEHSSSTVASVVGSHADDIAVMSMHNDSDADADARSDGFSESGFTEAGFSEAGFSELGEGGVAGVMTPSSWTDVGSDDGSEWEGQGGLAQGTGHVSQVQGQLGQGSGL
jgi:hypothetical protein